MTTGVYVDPVSLRLTTRTTAKVRERLASVDWSHYTATVNYLGPISTVGYIICLIFIRRL